jgi:hypothetical protein
VGTCASYDQMCSGRDDGIRHDMTRQGAWRTP